MSIEHMICFIYSELCKTIISWRKKCGFFGSVFNKIIPYNSTPSFLSLSHFVNGMRIYHGIALTFTKLMNFNSQGIFIFLFATVFN